MYPVEFLPLLERLALALLDKVGQLIPPGAYLYSGGRGREGEGKVEGGRKGGTGRERLRLGEWGWGGEHGILLGLSKNSRHD